MNLLANLSKILLFPLTAVINHNHRRYERERLDRNLMTAIQTLNASVLALTAAVDNAVSKWAAPNPNEEALLAAAAAVDAQTSRLNATFVDPAPDPAPDPVTPDPTAG